MAEPKKGGKALLMMFGKPKGDGAPDGDGAPMGGDYSDEFREACDEAYDAMKSGDKAGFCEALAAAMDQHKMGGATPPPEEEPEEPEGAA